MKILIGTFFNEPETAEKFADKRSRFHNEPYYVVEMKDGYLVVDGKQLGIKQRLSKDELFYEPT